MDIVCVPIIVSIVFLVIEIYKKVIEKFSRKEMFLRVIPLISAGLGVLLGILSFYIVPQIMTATDIFAAMAVGGASGLSATGCNQVFKQLNKFGVDVIEYGEKDN